MQKKSELNIPPFPIEFIKRMKAMLGDCFEDFINSYSQPPVRGLRVNTLRISPDQFIHYSPFDIKPTGLIEEGFYIEESARGAGRHPYGLAGLYYMQEPSAMLPISKSGIKPGMKVLDMCASPGGKAGGAAQRLCGEGILLANEMIPSRVNTLVRNLERLGVTNSAVTCCAPETISNTFKRYFDVVLVDAPCSGEGMFRKDETAIVQWSVSHVNSCAKRQAHILDHSAETLKYGGRLVYSTCTFSLEENEGVINSFLARNREFSIVSSERLYPHTFHGEGHFTAVLEKRGPTPDASVNKAGGHAAVKTHRLAKSELSIFNGFYEDTFESGPSLEACPVGDNRVAMLPSALCGILGKIRYVSIGIDAGRVVKGRFEPSHSLFMAAGTEKPKRIISFVPSSETLSSFLRGEEIQVDTDLSGYCAVAVECGGCQYILGFGKAVRGRLKNHYPKGLRRPS